MENSRWPSAILFNYRNCMLFKTELRISAEFKEVEEFLDFMLAREETFKGSILF